MDAESVKTRSLIFLLACFFLIILGTSIVYRFNNPHLVAQRLQEPAPGADPEIMQTIGALMQHVAKNPSDQNALLHLAENLMAMGQWQTAENFAQKALALEGAGQTRALYLLALIHHNMGRNDQAAELLENLLKKEDNPSARYSLGILYTHFLNRPEDGKKEFQKGIANEKTSSKLKEAMMEELGKLDKTK